MKIFDHIKDIKRTSFDFNGENIKIDIKDIIANGDILKIYSNASVTNEQMNLVYYEDGFNIYWKDKTNLIIDLEIKEGLITPTKKCLFIDKTILPLNIDFKDLSQYMVPDNIILIKIDDKYEINNIKSIIKELILYILIS